MRKIIKVKKTDFILINILRCSKSLNSLSRVPFFLSFSKPYESSKYSISFFQKYSFFLSIKSTLFSWDKLNFKFYK